MDATQTKSDVLERCETEDVRLVRLLYVGNDGITRGHAVPTDELESAFESGVGLPESVQSLTALDRRILDGQYDSVGEARLVPDPATFRVLPHEERCAAMLCDVETLGGDPWPADPRSRLRAFLDRLAEDGYEPSTAFETEFHLLRETEEGVEPHDERGVYSTRSARQANDLVLEMVDALEAQGVGVKKYYPEHAPGKHEIVTAHAAGMDAVTDYLFQTETVRGVAEGNDLLATFLPKPVPDATNGLHVHLSLWDDDGDNAFYDDSARGPSAFQLSETARHFVGGLLEHAPALVALTAPSVNSYARLRPQVEASAFTCWGLDNREAMVRIPSADRGSEPASTRLEFRPADNSSNPYLALLGILAAGKDGIDRELDPGEPLDADPGNLDPTERERREIRRLPKTLGAACDALAENEVLREALGEELHASYLEVKRSEWEAFAETAGSWNRETLRRLL